MSLIVPLCLQNLIISYLLLQIIILHPYTFRIIPFLLNLALILSVLLPHLFNLFLIWASYPFRLFFELLRTCLEFFSLIFQSILKNFNLILESLFHILFCIFNYLHNLLCLLIHNETIYLNFIKTVWTIDFIILFWLHFIYTFLTSHLGTFFTNKYWLNSFGENTLTLYTPRNFWFIMSNSHLHW